MSDASNVTRSLRERLGGNTEERLGRALTEVLESPLLTGAVGRAFDAREKAAQAQEVAMGALNIPSAADIERLTRRLRSVSNRLESIEDGVHRLDRALSLGAVEERLSLIEEQLQALTRKLDDSSLQPDAAQAAQAPAASVPGAGTAGKAKPAGAVKAGKAKTASRSRAKKGSAPTP